MSPPGRPASFLTTLLLVLSLLDSASVPATGQVLPDGMEEVPFVCEAREGPPRQAASEAERLEQERRARYREVFPAYLAAAPSEPPEVLLMPVQGVRVASVVNTWGGLRDGGRFHEGQDIFAPSGTPVLAAAPGYVYRIGLNWRGGNVVVVVAGGGQRHYYAHLSEYGDIREGQYVDESTVIGYVGNSGNAASTPPHLHFGVYVGPDGGCGWSPIDPLPMLVDRVP